MGNDSLYTGISALNADQSWIDMISNNIANSATIGFKGQRMTFADTFYQSQGFASGPTDTSGGVNPQQTGLGVKVNTVNTLFGQGGLETTGVNTDLALNGDGFFVLRNANGTGAPVYTRDGAFSLNANGMLYDPGSGLAVQGYMADGQGAIPSNAALGDINIPMGLTSQATGTGFGAKTGPTSSDSVFDVLAGGNLDQTQWAQQEQYVEGGGTGTPGTAKTITTTIYDSLGNAHQVTLTFTPDATGASAGPPATNGLPATVNDPSGTAHSVASRWQITASFSDGTEIDGATSATIGYAYFDQNGQFINTSGDAPAATVPDVHVAGALPSETDGNELNITQWGTGTSDAATAPTGTGAPATGAIGLSFADMTSLASDYSATIVSQNGYAAGTLQNITIGQDGTVYGAFSNGQTQTLAQVALATFQNEDGLSRTGSNMFSETAASGLAQVGTANSGRFVNTTIQSGSLEDSNVSLSDQFTKLIIAQRAFEANSRGIETADQDMQTVNALRASEN